MSIQLASERVYYVHCNLCNTILAVGVPSSCSLSSSIVTVRCGHCANLLSVNIGAASLHQHQAAFPPQDAQKQQMNREGGSSSSKCNKFSGFVESADHHAPRSMPPPIRTPEKRQRVPSAYNRFMKEEIQRIKAGKPEISHREAFSTAAKNWAHFPHIHFGLKLDGKNKQLEQPIFPPQKTNGYY